KVLSAASAMVPLVKTGGLADVVGALPRPLGAQGVEMRVFLPGSPTVIAAVKRGKRLHRYEDLFGGRAEIFGAVVGETKLFCLDAPHLFDRPGSAYAQPGGADWADNWRRFAAFSRAAADIAGGALASWKPDLLHAHDW